MLEIRRANRTGQATRCWQRWKAGGEGDNRGGDGRMASPTRWPGVWASSRRWWQTGKRATGHGVTKSDTTERRNNWTTSTKSHGGIPSSGGHPSPGQGQGCPAPLGKSGEFTHRPGLLPPHWLFLINYLTSVGHRQLKVIFLCFRCSFWHITDSEINVY